MVRASDDLTLKYAQQHVAHFRREDGTMRDHHEAMDCFDCEAYLQLGIDAFHWLVRADTVIRQAIFQGTYQHDPEVDAILRGLFQVWLEASEGAEQWSKTQEERGYTVTNIEKFRDCREEVRAIVDSFGEQDNVMPESLVILRDEALREHGNGQTAEFF